MSCTDKSETLKDLHNCRQLLSYYSGTSVLDHNPFQNPVRKPICSNTEIIDLHPYAAQHPTLTYALTRRTGVRTPKQEFIEFFVRTPSRSKTEVPL